MQIEYIRKHKKIAVAGAVAIGLVLMYLLFDWTVGALVHAKKEVMVPDLRGKSVDESMTLLSTLNLELKKEGEEFDQALPPGMVVRQNPAGGMMVREGKAVRVTVSQGGETIYVPDLVGQAIRSAEIAIRSCGLTLGEESSRYSVVQDKDHVLSQDPPAGSTAEKDSLVNIVISAGLPPATLRLMPQFTGKSVEEVRRWADANAIALDTRQETAAGVAPGTVLRQDIVPDTDIATVKRLEVVVAGAE